MSARTPQDVDRLFAEALNAGQLDALVALYEPQGTLMPSPGKLVTGTAAIRESLAGFLAGKPKMTITARLVAQSGDLAVTSAKWEMSMTGPDGKPANMTGESVEVVRRQDDGSWRAVIDLPFGAVA
ncbi:MAG TPA: SgcJ/EcaC family oxidoreductase [Casimicrobiaceae bacterium]|nr:SgcJ/EcaC family oxidoreductase [Casimicrobiaceae bacterium]